MEEERKTISLDSDISAEGKAMQEKGEKLMKELDKESATRTLSGFVKKVFFVVCVLVSCYHLYTAAFGGPVTLVHRSLHVGMMLAMTFVMYPFCSKSDHKKPTIVDWLLVILSFAAPVYIYTDYLGVVERAGNASNADMWMATLLVVLVLEASRRVSGNALSILSMIFILYGIFGRSMPSLFMHRGYDWLSLSNHFFANTEGIYGTSVDVAASYIFLFILFGCVMQKCGMGQFFNDIALALAGHTKGGPAKVSVIASGFLGSINGSAVANVVTTGAFTIPLMKKTGYSKEFAGCR